MSFKSRPYEVGDYPSLQNIYDQCFDVQDSEYWPPDALKEFATEETSQIYVLEDETSQSIAGFIYSRSVLDEAELLIIGMGKNYRGNALSGGLLDYMIADLKERGIQRVFLEVKDNNNPALRLYRSRGFDEVGRRDDYYKSGTSDKHTALVMSLTITPSI